MASRFKFIPITDFRGGRSAADDPLSLADNQVVQARNGEFFRTTLFKKDGGATAPAIGSAFTGKISALIRHSPDNNPGNNELWGVDDAATPVVARMAGATTFSAVTLKDNVQATPTQVRGASYKGKLFLTYNSSVDRLHVWDPNLASPSVRRVGLATPSAPTVANQGVGGYAATLRYYRLRYRIKNGTTIVAQSEPSASVSFTPDGASASARVTKSAAISESETHWMLEASANNIDFYELSEIAVATTTYDDSAAVSSYANNTISAVTGAYTVPTSCKYVIAAFNRLLLAGSFEGGLQSRVYYTPAAGTSDRADDERVPNTTEVKNRFDLDEGTGGDITGFAGPIYGSVYVFKYSQIRKVIPTGVSSLPFDIIDLSLTAGALEQECIDIGIDAEGRSAVYFLDAQRGPMVVGSSAPQEIGAGIRDLWDTVNLAATTKVGQVLYYSYKGQVFFWFATGSNNYANVLAKYTIATGGWAVKDTGGKVRQALAAVLFAKTPGALMSRDLVPYVSYGETANKLLRCDTTDTDDDSTAFQALVKTKPLAVNDGRPIGVQSPWVLAKAAAGVTLTMTADLDFGRETQTGTVLLTPDGSETRVFRKVEGLELTQAAFVQIQIGDAAAISNAWTIERLYIPVEAEDTPV